MRKIKNLLKFDTLSNIFHGKIVKLPIIKQLYNLYCDIRLAIDEKICENYYINDCETQDMKLIWGLASYDDLSGKNPCLYTMNDIDLIYLKDEKKYILDVETVYLFTTQNGRYNYMRQLLDEFTNFMNENGYDTTKEFILYDVFTEGININTHFDSIEECYAAFKMLVNGFCSLEKKEDME